MASSRGQGAWLVQIRSGLRSHQLAFRLAGQRVSRVQGRGRGEAEPTGRAPGSHQPEGQKHCEG